jgi:hypothetical protein
MKGSMKAYKDKQASIVTKGEETKGKIEKDQISMDIRTRDQKISERVFSLRASCQRTSG